MYIGVHMSTTYYLGAGLDTPRIDNEGLDGDGGAMQMAQRRSVFVSGQEQKRRH